MSRADRIARISVPKSRQLVATSDGLMQRRRLRADGLPECVPFYPHEFAQRQSDLGLLDYSALPIPSASQQDFDPLERERLRQCIERYGGERSLIGLADDELDGALGFIRRDEGRIVPTVAGLLILGREAALREHLPTHEVAFQVLDGTQVRVNDFYRTPLLKTFERIEEQFRVRVVENEIQVGLFRVPVPNYEPRAFREAVVNALVHRDYTRLGAVHVRWEADAIVVSNPGGFVEGVTLDNLLVVEPRPRNPLLADVIKRIGLAERTGRGHRPDLPGPAAVRPPRAGLSSERFPVRRRRAPRRRSGPRHLADRDRGREPVGPSPAGRFDDRLGLAASRAAGGHPTSGP